MTKAIIDFTHKQSIPEYVSYKSKSPNYYRNYYGMKEDVWCEVGETSRQTQSQYLESNVLKYNMAGHTAFLNDRSFVSAIDYDAWTTIPYINTI